MTAPTNPEGIRYTKEHEWVFVESDGRALVGITDYAAHELGDVVYVDLPVIGSLVQQSQKFGEIESVKAVSDLYSPVSGDVIDVNPAVVSQPELVNQSPFVEGWMLAVRPSDPGELDGLMTHAQYTSYLEELGRQALGGA